MIKRIQSCGLPPTPPFHRTNSDISSKKKKSRGRVTLHRRHVEVLGKGIVEFEKSIWIPAEEVSTLIGSINQDKKHKTTAESNGLPEE